MQNRLKSTKTAAIITIVLLMASMTFLEMPVQAQYTNMQPSGSIPLPAGVTPDVTKDTRAFLSFNPNIIGANQSLLVNIWLNPALHVSRYFTGYKVTFTKPDGATDVVTKDSYYSDSTAWFQYIPDQVGNWTVQFEFPGGYYPAGNYTAPAGSYVGNKVVSFAKSVYYKPSSSPKMTFTVQSEIMSSWSAAALPTDYWTRPASLNNREWWPILGNYPGTGYVGGGPVWDELYPNTNPTSNDKYAFTPFVQGPNTCHIVWKRQAAVAGLIGGIAGQYGTTSSPGTPSVVYSGRCYQTVTKPGVGSVAQCYDLRTGEIYYEIPVANGGVTPSYIAYVSPDYQTVMTGAVPGTEAQYTWSAELLTVTGGRLIKVDPWSGAVTLNVSISPLSGTGGTYYKNTFFLTVQGSRLINWTTVGSTTNFAQRIMSNTTYAQSSLPGSYGGVIDFESGYYATVAGDVSDTGAVDATGTASTGTATKMTIAGYNLWTGAKIWNITVNEAQYNPLCNIADHGKVAILTQSGYFLAYDLATGKQAWQGEKMAYPWGESSFGDYGIQSAYGMFFWASYDGIYAFNWTSGKIVWHYAAPALAPFESPYTSNGLSVYSFMAMYNTRIADGKMYTYNGEHSASWPITRGWSIHCINITTGEGLWRISGQQSPGSIADGYLTAANTWDGYMYVYGKGKSATTVSAPQTTIPLGESLVVTGNVLDRSPAQAGTPCVSAASMTTQMEYLHMGQSIGGLWGNETITGVPVSIDTVDPNNNYNHVGDAVSDGYTGTFGFTWKPEIAGQYKVIATFKGDGSYGSSMAATYVNVGEAPTATPTAPPVQAPIDYTWTIVGMGIAIIIAVILSTVLLLRKRQ